jgi:LacI family transcriptional regulator
VPTIHDVARAAGVSTATVSRVLNGNARVSDQSCDRVLAAAATLDYWPNAAARSLRQRRSHALGILLPDLYGEFFSEVIRGIDHEARRAKFQVLISSSHGEAEAIATARSMRGRVDGLVVMAPDSEWIPSIDRNIRRFPAVFLNTRSVNGSSAVTVANAEGAREVVGHLLALGHRTVAVIKGPRRNTDADERLAGYRQAMAAAGIQLDPALEIAGDFTESSGFRAAEELLALEPRPSAVFATNDYMAIGLMSALGSRAVRIPSDMAVAGFDDIAIAQYVTPALTTVHVDAYELGACAVRLLINTIGAHKGNSHRHEILPATLVIRQSTQAATGRSASFWDPDPHRDSRTRPSRTGRKEART